MLILDEQSVEYVLAGAILLGRIGDIASTWFVSPRLQLEANPLVRRMRWPFAWLTLLLCFIPFWSTPMGLVVAIVSFLVAAQNLSQAWIARALGEARMREIQLEAARNSTLGRALALTWLASVPIFLCSGLILIFGGTPGSSWGSWVAFAVGLYGFALAYHKSLYLVRLFRTG